MHKGDKDDDDDDDSEEEEEEKKNAIKEIMFTSSFSY